MKKIINKEIPFFEFNRKHLELILNHEILIKTKNGKWDIVWYYDTDKNGKAIFESRDRETDWTEDDIELWTFLPSDL